MLNDRGETLGLRLDAAISRRLAAHVRRTKRSKSDIAREALDRYLGRDVPQEEIDRQLALIAAADAFDDFADVDRLSASAREDFDWSESAK